MGAQRLQDGTLSVQPSVANAATDGDDHVEGNGGNDVIFGNLGQDDIIGGSSSLFSLDDSDKRTDAAGADMLFGGAGTDLARNDLGDTTNSKHAVDSDVILGDNGNIYRLIDANGEFLQFSYDQTLPGYEDRGALRIVVRAAELLDYTEGGLDHARQIDPTVTELNDIGASDEIHGESGDDFIYGMGGNDLLFGDGQDDDIIGGTGHDWISGGTGDDGILGDDGRILTSRNSSAFGEALFGIAAIPAAELNLLISTASNAHYAIINVDGQLKKTALLTPASLEFTPGNYDPAITQADDILFGGWGNDSIHGGMGDDAISGAEALAAFFDQPFNPGNILAYNSTTAEFALYDENNPRVKIADFILNFDAQEGPLDTHAADVAPVPTDGDDVLFGDLGHDWMVGGTGRDHLYGGWGDDLLNVDDNLDTNGGLNDTTDTHPSYDDLAFGGAGRDILNANTGGDRLIDWNGEFNSYLAPFSPFGLGTVSRSPQPQLMHFLYDLAKSDGADLRGPLAVNPGASARNGEPFGELGLVTSQDAAWGDQHAAPADPQPGNGKASRDKR